MLGIERDEANNTEELEEHMNEITRQGMADQAVPNQQFISKLDEKINPTLQWRHESAAATRL